MKVNLQTKAATIPTTRDDPPFLAAQCDALFAAVLVHDDWHPDAALPEAIHLDYTQAQLTQCYRICRQLWQEGVDRAALRALIAKIGRERALTPAEQLSFKYIRAKFKHLRFAHAAFAEGHRYPLFFHWLTGLMGNLQDAFKHERAAAVARLALLLRLVLARAPYALIARSVERFRPSTTDSFRAYVSQEIGFIRLNLAKEEITSKEFHEIRKVISRQVALYDNLKILHPSPYHDSISRYLSTINGMMGSMHDGLILRKFAKTQDYYADTFAIPEEIKRRLMALTESHASAT